MRATMSRDVPPGAQDVLATATKTRELRLATVSFYSEQVLPRFIDVALGKAVVPIRRRVLEGLSGEVLEIGFGSGRNLPYLPSAVTRVLAVEPAGTAWRIASRRIGAAGIPVELIGTDGQDLAIPDASVDHVLVTWVLCTVPDMERALTEARRVLRPGGSLHFVEHGRSPHRRVADWQDRITPIWQRLFGGCHLNRPIDKLIEAGGFRLDTISTYRIGPELAGFMYEGVASKEP